MIAALGIVVLLFSFSFFLPEKSSGGEKRTMGRNLCFFQVKSQTSTESERTAPIVPAT